MGRNYASLNGITSSWYYTVPGRPTFSEKLVLGNVYVWIYIEEIKRNSRPVFPIFVSLGTL